MSTFSFGSPDQPRPFSEFQRESLAIWLGRSVCPRHRTLTEFVFITQFGVLLAIGNRSEQFVIQLNWFRQIIINKTDYSVP